MQLSCQEDRGVQWQYWRMLGKMPRLLLSQVRSQRVIPLQGARAGREKGGCQREGGARPRPCPAPWLGAPVGRSLWLMCQLQCCRRVPTLPLPCFSLQSPVPWGQLEQVVVTGKERKAGGRKGGPGKAQNLSGRAFQWTHCQAELPDRSISMCC